MIFAREVNDSLASLAKKLDEVATSKIGKKARMGSFFVFLSDDEKLEGQLKNLAKKEDLKKVVLTIDNPAGPKAYKISKDAAVTVVLYDRRDVKYNHAYRRASELTPQAVDQIVAEMRKVLSSD
jgi:hypothetical protein